MHPFQSQLKNPVAGTLGQTHPLAAPMLTQRHRQCHRPASGRPNPCPEPRGWLPSARLSDLVSGVASGGIGFRKAFWLVRADLLYLTEPLILLVGAGRFERPTPCAQGRCATRLRYAPTFADYFILNHFQLPSKSTSLFLRPNCIKTVSKPFQFGLTVSKLLPCSLV